MGRKEKRAQARYERRVENLEARYAVDLQKYKDEMYDKFLMLYVVDVALAVYDVYGNMPTRIQKVMRAFNNRILGEQDLQSAIKELRDKTGINFTITD